MRIAPGIEAAYRLPDRQTWCAAEKLRRPRCRSTDSSTLPCYPHLRWIATFPAVGVDARARFSRLLAAWRAVVTRLSRVFSAHLPRFPLEEVHQNELPKRHRRREVGFAAADFGDALHEFDERAVAREHERVDHDPAPTAVGNLT